MHKLFNLIRNENMKLYGRIATWIMIGLLAVAVLLIALLIKFTSNTTVDPNWKESLTKQTEDMKKQLPQVEESGIKTAIDQLNNQIKINEYRIKNDLPPTGAPNTLWGFEGSTTDLMSLISLFTIIIAGGIVAREFSDGTIKLLLIRPSKRWKILLSKYITTLIASLGMILFLFVFSFIIGGLFFGFSGVDRPFLSITDGAIKEVSMTAHIFAQYGYKCINLIMMATFAFMISTVFRNSTLSTGLAIFLMFTGVTIVQLLSRYNWTKYILFANTDLSMYTVGPAPIPVEGMTLTFSITVLVVYFIAFLAISWLGFAKRDVAA